MSTKADNWMIAWNKSGEIKVGPWPDHNRWSDEYDFTVGCCFAAYREMSNDEKQQHLLGQFVDLVLGWGIDPKAANSEFRKISTWCDLK